MSVPSVTNAQGQVSVIQMQWSPEAGAKGTFDQYTHYDKRDDFTFPIVIFPFINTSNIPASPAHGVYISQLLRYSRACAQYIH